MSDVLLVQTNDDGDIDVTDGVVSMTQGFESAVFLSLFGGNVEDDGRVDNFAQWWANHDEPDAAAQYRSELQHLLGRIPAVSGNLRRLEDAARRDLAWLLDEKVASSVEVAASLSGVNLVRMRVDITAAGVLYSFEFTENWRGRA